MCSELTVFTLSAISCSGSVSVWLSDSCCFIRSAACLAAHSSSCLRWLQSVHLQDQQIYSIMNSQCFDACWVIHQSENDCRKWTELHCTWVTVFLASASKSLCIFFDTYVQLLSVNNVFVCLSHITEHWHSAILKSSLMHVLLWSWAVSRVGSVECLNEAYSHLHLCRERFK